MDAVLLLLRLLLAGTFAVAGFSKAADRKGTRQSVVDFGAPGWLASLSVWLLPAAEIICAVALLPAATAFWGAAGTAGLLFLFIAAIGHNLARGRRPKCHCFGQLHSEPVGWPTLARNAVLTAMAGWVLWEARAGRSPGFGSWLAGLDRFESAELIFALALAALAALWMWSVLHLLKQNGRLLLRLEALEAEIGGRPEPAPPGLAIDSPAPPFRLAALDGSIVTLEALRRANDNIMLVFVEPGCGGCDALMPDLAQWQEIYSDRLAVAVISRGALEANRAKASQHRIKNFLLEVNEETSQAYQAEGTPTAVVVRNGRIASHVAGGAEAIHQLLDQALVPPPLALGEPAPDLAFPDLDGDLLPLRTLRGGRHLLLFWNPDCGFCQAIRSDLQNWEREASEDAPRMLVISTGTVEANRAQDFQSRVVLDQAFQAGQAFGVDGTPAAIILDEQGRVASAPGVGAEEVLRLARGTGHTLPVR